MSTAEIMERIGETPPKLKTRLVGFYYLLTISTGLFVLLFRGKLAFTADLVAAAFCIAATVLLYVISKPAKAGNVGKGR